MRRTKIIATIGPASSDIKILEKIILAGMDVARLNFSYSDYSSHKKTIQNIRLLSKKLNKTIAILQDLSGPKFRIGKFKDDKIKLKKGQLFNFLNKDILGNENCVSFKYKEVFSGLKEKTKILLDDGLMQMEVVKINNDEITCKVLTDGELSSHKGVNILGEFNIPSLTEKDKSDILFGIENKVDWISLSFVRKKDDVLQLKEIISKNNSDIPVIAKIEKPQAIKNLDEIIQISDGVMIARGDLGVEMPQDEIPLLQRIIIDKSHKYSKPVIVATQMLQSMINNPRPTRAEVSDVAGAVFEGADAIMLSGETAIGSYPIEAVNMMNKIANRVENHLNYYEIHIQKNPKKLQDITQAISHSAVEIAQKLSAKLIVAATSSGFTAKMISFYKPKQNILAMTQHPEVQKRMNLFWGVYPVLIKKFRNIDELINIAEKEIKEKKYAKSGDFIVIVGGTPVGVKGKTNFIKVISI